MKFTRIYISILIFAACTSANAVQLSVRELKKPDETLTYEFKNKAIDVKSPGKWKCKLQPFPPELVGLNCSSGKDEAGLTLLCIGDDQNIQSMYLGSGKDSLLYTASCK